MPELSTWEDAVRWLMAQPDRQEFVKACYFDQPTLTAAERYAESEEWQAALAWLPKANGRALDVGAGNGIVSYALTKAGWATVALEPDPSHLVGAGAIRKLALDSRSAIEVVEEFGEQMPFPAGAFQLVYARQVMHHARDLQQFCREAARILAPGGTFIGSREHVISSARQLPTFLATHPLHELYGGEHAYTQQEYLKALRGAGLQIKRVLRPFDSPMNYAPQTKATLQKELQDRLRRWPLGMFAANALSAPFILSCTMRILSQVDRRAGRVFTFIATKPE